MAISVIMPALEMAQETGKVLSWRKKEGDRVSKGEPLLEIETDKAVVEIESPGEGILAGVTAQAGAVIPVGQTIGWLVKPGETPPAAAAPAVTGRRQDSEHTQASASPQAGPAAPSPAGGRVSPKARRLAREHGVDLAHVRGSGSGGEILAEDILAAASSGSARASESAAPGAGGTISAGSTKSAGSADSSVRATVATTATPNADLETPGLVGRLMAERTTQSWTTAPHFFVTREIDAGQLIAAREKFVSTFVSGSDGKTTDKPTHTDLLVALVARVLAVHPRMNASWTPAGIRLHSDVNVAVAMAVDDGVVAPVIHKANTATVAEISSQRRQLTERARTGKLQPADLAGATFTISNLGMYGVDAFTAIIVSPQAGILAVARIADRVVPVDGHPVIRPMLTLTLSTDHRVADGARAAAFLNDLATAISDPQKSLG
jgi:pyruvate dehydrogenase E2 component (dihydrolipoamide acetyltransferase)